MGAVVWTNTREASPTEMLVPLPTLVFGINSTGSIVFPGQRPIGQPSFKPAGTSPTANTGTDIAPAPSAAAETPNEAVDDKPEAADDESPAPEAGELTTLPNTETVSATAPELAQQSEAVTAAHPTVGTQAPDGLPAVFEAEAPTTPLQAEHHPLELSIDSLPHLQLVETIPVTIVSLGDQLFTATVDALNLSGTGDTLSDTLIVVKEQIEALYEKLMKNTGLDEDEKHYLSYLHSHIKSSEQPARQKRGIWR